MNPESHYNQPQQSNQHGPPPVPPIQPQYTQFNHTLHLVLTVLSCGLWAAVWIPMVFIHNSNQTKMRLNYQSDLENYNRLMWMRSQPQG